MKDLSINQIDAKELGLDPNNFVVFYLVSNPGGQRRSFFTDLETGEKRFKEMLAVGEDCFFIPTVTIEGVRYSCANFQWPKNDVSSRDQSTK